MANKVLVPKSEEFSLRIIKLYKYLQDEKREFIRSKQLLRSGTSIGAYMKPSMPKVLLILCQNTIFL